MSLRFSKVDSREKFEEWKKFADSFNHANGNPITPIFTCSRGDKMFGYYTVLPHPVLFPAFHPEICSPRDFRDMVEAFSNAQCLASISQQYPHGVSYIGLEKNLPVDRDIVSKMGYENLEIELHQRLP